MKPRPGAAAGPTTPEDLARWDALRRVGAGRHLGRRDGDERVGADGVGQVLGVLFLLAAGQEQRAEPEEHGSIYRSSLSGSLDSPAWQAGAPML